MLLSVLFVILGVTVVTQAQQTPKGLHFVGVGYNLLEGNPEGGDVSNGGVDPGLLFTRKIFKLTWKQQKVTVDNKFLIPDQVSFAPRESCVTTNKKEVFSGSKSYQDKLNLDVDSSGEYNSQIFTGGSKLFRVCSDFVSENLLISGFFFQSEVKWKPIVV